MASKKSKTNIKKEDDGFNTNSNGKLDDVRYFSSKKMETPSSAGSVIALRREIGLLSAISLIVSVMIGSGIFVSPSRVLDKSGSVGLCLIVWGICGLISYFGALSFAELGILVPSSGAEYVFYRAAFLDRHRFFGPLPSFIYIWVIVFLVRPAEVAILVLTFSEYVFGPTEHYLAISFSPHMESILKKLISLLAISLITYINFSSVKMYVRLQNMFSFLKIVACGIIIGGGIYHLAHGNTDNINKGFEGSKTNVKDLVMAFYTGLWSFDGWNIPLSISMGVPLITLLYVLMNVSYMSVLTVEEMIRAPAVAMAFASKIFGCFAFIIPLAVVLATFSCAMSVQFGVSRLCFAAGKCGHMIRCFSYIHIKKRTPAPAVLLQGTLTILFIIVGRIEELIELVSFMIWIFYGLAFVALLVLKQTRRNVPRPYKVPIVIPIFLILMSAFFAVVPLVLEPDPQFLGAIGFLLVGIIVYYFLIYKERNIKVSRCFSYYVQLLLQVIPPEQ